MTPDKVEAALTALRHVAIAIEHGSTHRDDGVFIREALSVLTEALAERGWRPIAEAPDGFGIGLFLGYEPGDFGPVVYGMCRGPLGDWKLGADPEFEVSPTHFALMPSTRELPHDR